MGVRHHHGHQGAAAAGAGTGDIMGRLAWRHGRSRAPFRPWRAVHQPRVHHQGRGIRHASLDRHGRRLVRQRHGRERRRRVQDRARLATQALPGFEGPGIGDVPVGLVVELEASAPVLGLRDTGTDRNRVLCKPSGASRPTIRAEQKSGHINESRVLALRQWGMAALYGSGDVSDLTLWPVDFRIGAIWFLLALFWARLLLHFFAKLPYTFIWVIACFLVGYGSSRYVWLPWSIQAGMCAVAFLYLGYLAKKYDVLDFVRRVPYIWIIAFLIWIIDIVFFDGMSMAMNSYGPHPILAVVGSIAGTLCVIGISQLFDKVAVLGDTFSRIGQASLAILCAHLIEDDVLLQSWQSYLDMLRTLFPQVPLVLLSFIVRLPIDFAGAALLHYVPKINEWFYPQLAKQHQLNRAGIVHKRAFPLEK